MRKRLLLLLAFFVLLAWMPAACQGRLKMVPRQAIGTATRTPFLLKATYTSVNTPLEMAGEEALGSASQAGASELTLLPETSEEGDLAAASATPSATPTLKESQTDPPADSQLPPPTATQKPTKPPATAAPTEPDEPPLPTSTPPDTNTPEPPPDTNTPKPPTATPTPGECVWSGNAGFESQVITLINQERTDRGLSALVQNASLTQAARRHSQDMACTDTWSHTGSDGSTLGTRLLEAGYVYTWAAENIAASSSPAFSPASVVNMWMNSTGHRANILSPNAVHIGVGFRYAGDVDILPYDAYYTADFGKP